jgi:hypothetical protein
MTLLARRTSKGYAGNVVVSASDLLLFFSVHGLTDMSDVMSAAAGSKQEADNKHARTIFHTACDLGCLLFPGIVANHQFYSWGADGGVRRLEARRHTHGS